jgi:hypothetical protein
MRGSAKQQEKGSGSGTAEVQGSRSGMERKFWMALTLYAGLAVVAWFTMDEGKILVAGRPVELRLVPLLVFAGLALRTVLARQADRIRHEGQRDGQ